MPCAGKKFSMHLKYSCVAPGPPLSNNNLIVGLLPNLFVHTLNLPFGVEILIILTPPLCTPVSVLAKYPVAAALLFATGFCWQLKKENTAANRNK